MCITSQAFAVKRYKNLNSATFHLSPHRQPYYTTCQQIILRVYILKLLENIHLVFDRAVFNIPPIKSRTRGG